jgi:predicted DNA-binding transcriptional regulator AlpA
MKGHEMSRIAKVSKQAIEPRGLSRDDAAAYLGIGATLFDRLVSEERLPKSARLDGRIIWDRRQLDCFLDSLFEEEPVTTSPFAKKAM